MSLICVIISSFSFALFIIRKRNRHFNKMIVGDRNENTIVNKKTKNRTIRQYISETICNWNLGAFNHLCKWWIKANSHSIWLFSIISTQIENMIDNKRSMGDFHYLCLLFRLLHPLQLMSLFGTLYQKTIFYIIFRQQFPPKQTVLQTLINI